jgi:hypothetical protein
VHCRAVPSPSRSSNAVAQFVHCRAVQTLSRSSYTVAQFEPCRAVRTLSRSSITVAQFEPCRAVRTSSRSSNAVAQFHRRRAVPSSSRSSNAVAQFHHRRAVRTLPRSSIIVAQFERRLRRETSDPPARPCAPGTSSLDPLSRAPRRSIIASNSGHPHNRSIYIAFISSFISLRLSHSKPKIYRLTSEFLFLAEFFSANLIIPTLSLSL